MSKLCVIKCYEFVICVPCFRCFFRGQVPGCLPIISHPYAGHSSGQGINQAGARATASPPFPFRHIFHNIRHYGRHRRTMLRMRNISYAPYSPDAAPSLPSGPAAILISFSISVETIKELPRKASGRIPPFLFGNGNGLLALLVAY